MYKKKCERYVLVMGRLDCSLPSVIPLPYSEWCLALGATSNASITAYLYHTTTTYLHTLLPQYRNNSVTIEGHTCRIASGTKEQNIGVASIAQLRMWTICGVLAPPLLLFVKTLMVYCKHQQEIFAQFIPKTYFCVTTSIVLQLLCYNSCGWYWC